MSENAAQKGLAGGALDVDAKKKTRPWNKWDFAIAKARYFIKDPVRATVQAEYQHVIDWGDFCGLCLHVCDRPLEKTKWDPDQLFKSF